jgi:hypothetical protein
MDKMHKLSLLDLYLIFKTTNLRPIYKFLMETDSFDFETRELKISAKEALIKYQQWKKLNRKRADLIMMLEGRKGRPKKVNKSVN